MCTDLDKLCRIHANYWYFHYESDLQLIIVNLDPNGEPSCTVIVVTAGTMIVVQFITVVQPVAEQP